MITLGKDRKVLTQGLIYGLRLLYNRYDKAQLVFLFSIDEVIVACRKINLFFETKFQI